MLTPQYINSFYFFLLQEKDVPAILKLQNKVYEHLPANKKMMMLVKTAEELTKQVTSHGFMIGTKTHEKSKDLIAYSAGYTAVRPEDLAEFHMDKPFADSGKIEKCCILQSSATDPDFRNQKIHTIMNDLRVHCGNTLEKHYFFSEVAVENPASVKGFVDKDFHVVAAHQSPVDKCEVLIFHKNTKQEATPAHLPHMWVSLDPVAYFECLPHLIQQGFKSAPMQKCAQTPGGYLMFFKKPFNLDL